MRTDTLASVTTAARFPDPAKRWQMTKRAMRLWLAITEEKDSDSRESYAEWVESLPPVMSEDDYADRLETVRQEALDDRNSGHNCAEGTARFFEAFGFEDEPQDTDKCVTVTVTLHFHVSNTADADDTAEDVRRYLRVDVSGNVDDMDDVETTIDSVDVHTD